MSESIAWDDADGIRAPTRSPHAWIRHLLRRRTGAPVTEPTVRRFRRLPIEVEAAQVVGSEDGQTARDIAVWCHGSVSGTYQQPKVILDDGAARTGDWIVYEPGGPRILPDREFGGQYEEIDR